MHIVIIWCSLQLVARWFLFLKVAMLLHSTVMYDSYNFLASIICKLYTSLVYVSSESTLGYNKRPD